MDFLLYTILPLIFLAAVLGALFFPNFFFFCFFVFRGTIQPAILANVSVVFPVTYFTPLGAGLAWFRLFFKHGIRFFSLESILLFFLLLVFCISLMVNGVTKESLVELARFSAVVLLMQCMGVLGRDGIKKSKIFHGILYGSIILNLVAVIQFIINPHMNVSSLLEDKNGYGIYLSLLIFLFSYAWTKERSKKLLFALVLTVIVFILAKNRASWIAVWAVIFISSIRYRKNIKAVWALAMLIVVPLLFLPLIYDRFEDLERYDEWGTKRDTMAGRLATWEWCWDVIKDRPIFGYGPGTSVRVLVSPHTQATSGPHNDYLRVGIDGGMMAMLAYIGLMVCLLLRVSARKRSLLTAFQFAAVTYFIIISFAQNIIGSQLSMALIMYIYSLREPEPPIAPEPAQGSLLR